VIIASNSTVAVTAKRRRHKRPGSGYLNLITSQAENVTYYHRR